MSIAEEFLSLMPAAVAWAESRQADILRHGKCLNEFQRQLALEVGVAHPDKIRILQVANILGPEDPVLRAAGEKLGLFNWSPVGRALGYGVEIRSLSLAQVCAGVVINPTLYRHEFRHVVQCEQCGSVGRFLTEYLTSVAECGYAASRFEIDARLYETKSVAQR